MNLSDNFTHIILVALIVAMICVLVIFGHAYLAADTVFTAGLTVIGAIIGYKFGVGGTPPPTPPPAGGASA